jgi:hypothetical protein
MTNPLQQFIFVLAEPPHPENVEDLMGACDDASVEVGPTLSWVAFDREAPSLVDGIVSAVRNLTTAGLEPVYVRADDDLVTVEVVTRRVSGTRVSGTPEMVLNWAARQDFPAPVEPHPQRPVYSWSQVAGWLEVHFGQTWADTALTMRAVNLAIELRAIMPRIERGSGIRAVFWS